MNGLEFENLCAECLRKSGYRNVQVTKASGDYGVDILASKGGHRYAIQCKYYKNPVGNSAIQEVVAGMHYYNCDKAMVMTNSTFTKNAKELANANNVKLWEKVNKRSKKGYTPKDILICFAIYFIYEGGTFLSKYHPIIFGIAIGLLIACLFMYIIYRIFTREKNVDDESKPEDLSLEEMRQIWADTMTEGVTEQLSLIDEFASDVIMLAAYYEEITPLILQEKLAVGSERAEELIGVLEELGFIEKTKNENDSWRAIKEIKVNDKVRQQLMLKDEFLVDAIELVVLAQQVSPSMLQRRFRIGYNRACQIIDVMEAMKIVETSDGLQSRRVLWTEDDYCINLNAFDFDNFVKPLEQKNGVVEHDMKIETVIVDEKEAGEIPRIYEGYSPKPYKALSVFSNMLVEKSCDESFDLTMNLLCEKYSSSEMKFLLMDKECLYKDAGNLALPVIADSDKMKVALSWACSEMNYRYEILKKESKDFHSYNLSVPSEERFVNMFVIVSEVYDFQELYNDETTKINLIDLLIKGKRVGMFVLLFTKFKAKGLKLKEIADLLNVIDSEEYEKYIK